MCIPPQLLADVSGSAEIAPVAVTPGQMADALSQLLIGLNARSGIFEFWSVSTDVHRDPCCGSIRAARFKSCRKRGSADLILGVGLDTFALRNPHGARQIRIYEVDHPATRHGNASAWRSSNRTSAMAYSRASRFRAGRCGREARRRRLSAELACIFHLARGCAITDTGGYRPHSGLHVVNQELRGGVRLSGTSRGILRRAKAIRKGADRTA